MSEYEYINLEDLLNIVANRIKDYSRDSNSRAQIIAGIYREVNTMIERIPTADVRPVVRGEWIEDNDGNDCYCSICHNCTGCEYEYVAGQRGEWDFRFCGHCGADMRTQEGIR